MYFVTYQYNAFNEGGILTEDEKKVLPITTIGKLMGLKFPERLIDFIPIATDKLLADIQNKMAENPNLGINLSLVKLLAPIPKPPRNIFCLGKNYADHAKEIKNIPSLTELPESPIYFSKLPTSVTGPDTVILSHAKATKEIDYEVELAIIIGKEGSDIPKEKAEAYIFGYTIANDITARDLQKKHSQWYKGKSLDTFCPLGPKILHKSALKLPFNIALTCRVNGEIRQHSTTSHMIFDIPTIISDLSKGITLLPGDIILTGTPAGVGCARKPPLFLQHGDKIEAEIEKIGVLRNIIE
ncbi:fumarylacetoacetate hydrolase family protein [Acetobacterium tundrae]|uniref:Hydrolase n=1 Tax=Acetobacterium tundrae TaxID=132932 RepID=A0ABR6WHB6_9FIRM|nr:fumarylacetoacetate hydrolase family protein [Acetobacterium tundrae]MBC3795550.1 hydrolase [Acetobacterium tundrae]